MCVKPFALADYWAEATQDPNGNRLSDLGTGNGNNNTSENWNYDASQGDRYAQAGTAKRHRARQRLSQPDHHRRHAGAGIWPAIRAPASRTRTTAGGC